MFCTFFLMQCVKSGTAGSVPTAGQKLRPCTEKPRQLLVNQSGFGLIAVEEKKKAYLLYCSLQMQPFPPSEKVIFFPFFNFSNLPESHQGDYGSPFGTERAMLMVMTHEGGNRKRSQARRDDNGYSNRKASPFFPLRVQDVASLQILSGISVLKSTLPLDFPREHEALKTNTVSCVVLHIFCCFKLLLVQKADWAYEKKSNTPAHPQWTPSNVCTHLLHTV